MSTSERRLQSRFLCADLVRVSWHLPAALSGDAASDAQTTDAVLEDISALGACVEVAEAIPLDALITLSIGESRFDGRVCYSVFRDYGFFVGIRFLEHSSWSCETVVPRHLTSLDDLAQSARTLPA